MDECLDLLSDAWFFTTLDCNSEYWQIPVAEAGEAKAALTSHAWLFSILHGALWALQCAGCVPANGGHPSIGSPMMELSSLPLMTTPSLQRRFNNTMGM